MTKTLPDEILSKVQAADARLRQNPYYARLLAGEVDSDEYALWLVQLHCYVRHTVRGERALAAAMGARATSNPAAATIRDHALHEASEEEGHDELLVNDLAELWGVTPGEARGRIEYEPKAPSAQLWGGFLDLTITRYPEGVVGIALALESLAALHMDLIRDGLLGSGSIFGIENAISFVAAHCSAVESQHQAQGIERSLLLDDPASRTAALFFADAALANFEGIARFVAEQLPAAASA